MNENREDMIESAYPQKSILLLSFKTKNINNHLQSMIDELYFTPPFKILPPFYEERFASVILLLVSAGLMAGDRQEIKLTLAKDCKVRLLSQSFEKIHNTAGGYAKRQTFISVGENAELQYLPLPTIAFANSCFYNETQIIIHSHATLYYSEIFVAGRIGLGESFKMQCFDSKLKLYKNGKLLYFDNMIIEPHTIGMHTFCDFSVFTHYLNMIIVDSNCNIAQIKEILKTYSLTQNDTNSRLTTTAFNPSCIASITSIKKEHSLYCLKALAHSSEELLALREQICNF